MAEVSHDSGRVGLGANHWMQTSATLRDAPHIDGVTTAESDTWLGGFTGGTQLLFLDANGKPVGQSQLHQVGADGTMVGRNKNTQYWGEDIDAGLRQKIADFTILQFWAPRYSAVDTIINRAVQVGQELEPLIKELQDVGVIPSGKTK